MKHHEKRQYKILAVDDVESNLLIVEAILDSIGIDAELLSSGEDALHKIRAGEVYDIIFMDLLMPGMDGVQAAGAIRDTGYAGPIVALTAGDFPKEHSDIFSGFISKPLDLGSFALCLRRFIPNVNISALGLASPDLTASFVRDAERTISALSGAGPLDAKLFITHFHAIKSALANVGETSLSEAAAIYEQAGRDGDFKLIQEGISAFLASIKEASAARATAKGPDKADEDPAFLLAQLKIIQSSCQSYDIESANKAISALRKLSWSHKTGATIDKIFEHILHADFEEAANLCREGGP